MKNFFGSLFYCYDIRMKYLLIRHAKTDANRLTRIAFGKEGAPINSTGEQQSLKLGVRLAKLGIDMTNEVVAVSELLRTRQTAESAGFKHLSVRSILNEVNTDNPQRTLELVAQAKLPKQAVTVAKAIIANPPNEKLWVTHGLVIAAILVELKLSDPKNFIPDYCEIREVEF